jgi:signal transduction histidine kinase
MYGEMLRDGIVPSDAKRQEYYRHITAESERLSRLINNVLEFSRIEKGTRDMVLVTGSVDPVVQEAVALVRPHVEAEGFALRVETDGTLPPVRFERDALLQVLFNLVDNAVKYARDGAERWIVVRVAQADGGVRLAVRDSGPACPSGIWRTCSSRSIAASASSRGAAAEPASAWRSCAGSSSGWGLGSTDETSPTGASR